MTEVTRILNQIEDGDSAAAENLLPLVYSELRRLATQKMNQEQAGQTIQATALVHEAYIRLVDVKKSQQWDGRGHFFSAAAEAMRRILVERARRRQSLKRGGDRQRLELEEAISIVEPPAEEVLALHEHLDRLAATDPDAARLVKLRYFAGLTVKEAANLLGVSPRTADHLWTYARAWLHDVIETDEESEKADTQD